MSSRLPGQTVDSPPFRGLASSVFGPPLRTGPMTTPSDWPTPPHTLHLAPDEIHIWRAHVDAPEVRHWEARLSPDEHQRAARFAFVTDRNRFVASRGILREVLGQYLHIAPIRLRFAFGPNGKPRLVGDPDAPVRFNVSHSSRFAVYVFARDREVGIDIEEVRSELEVETIARRFFSVREFDEFRSFPPLQKTEAFFRGWTRKEAYLKGLGSGLDTPLTSFSVTMKPDTPETLSDGNGTLWALRSFQPESGYAGAVAAEGDDWTARFWNFQSSPREGSGR